MKQLDLINEFISKHSIVNEHTIPSDNLILSRIVKWDDVKI